MKKNMCSRCWHIIKPREETIKIKSKSSGSVYLLCNDCKNDSYTKKLLDTSYLELL